MTKTIVTAAFAALLLATASPAFASSCPKHMAAIDAALAKGPNLSAEQKGQVTSLRAQGEAFHKAGKHGESMQALSEAEKILGIR